MTVSKISESDGFDLSTLEIMDITCVDLSICTDHCYTRTNLVG